MKIHVLCQVRIYSIITEKKEMQKYKIYDKRQKTSKTSAQITGTPRRGGVDVMDSSKFLKKKKISEKLICE